MRQRINREAICSSDNYAVSKRLHKEYLSSTHEERVNYLMTSHSTEKPVGRPMGRPYVNVFGHKVYLNAYEVNVLGTHINIHYE